MVRVNTIYLHAELVCGVNIERSLFVFSLSKEVNVVAVGVFDQEA